MNFDEEKEIEYMNESINVLCDIADRILNSGNINSVSAKQKMCAVASFLEFVKAGADITAETKDSNSVSFIINMK